MVGGKALGSRWQRVKTIWFRNDESVTSNSLPRLASLDVRSPAIGLRNAGLEYSVYRSDTDAKSRSNGVP